jgi:predicted CoA-binding protein
MSIYRLKNLLSPHSVALVGASPRHGSVGRAILNNIRKAQFKGEFGLVNPRYHEIDGVAAVGSIAKLAFAPELVVLTAPARAIAGLIDEAGRRGAAGAVIVSAGLGHGPGSPADAAERAAQKYGRGNGGISRINPMNQKRVMRQLENIRTAQRCGARTRAGGACQCPAIRGRKRCRCTAGAVQARRRVAITATTGTGRLPPRLSRNGSG